MAPSHVTNEEIEDAKIRENKDKVAISLDAVFFRNLPRLGNASVVFGVSIEGIRADGKPFKAALDIRKGVGPHAFLSFNNIVAIEPFRYSGQNIRFSLQFHAVPPKNVPNVTDEFARWNKPCFRPPESADEGADFYERVIEKVDHADWKYSFTFVSADRPFVERPNLLLTAGRHVLIILPPSDASGFQRTTELSLPKRLRMRGVRLFDLERGTEYTDTPYIVINLTRLKRGESALNSPTSVVLVRPHSEGGSVEK